MKIPKCKSCGACCCHPDDPKWVEVTVQDSLRIPKEIPLNEGDIATFSMPYLRGSCLCLEGDIGKKCFCSIYAKRPSICRKVKRGSPICLYMMGYHKIDIGLTK
jgi:Fe-S-cluster containining protein